MRVLLFILLLQFNFTASAGGTVPFGYISEFVSGNILRVTHSNLYVNPDGCGDAFGYVLATDDSVSNKRLYATILAAHIANKEVSFWVEGCLPTPWGNLSLPIIKAITIKP